MAQLCVHSIAKQIHSGTDPSVLKQPAVGKEQTAKGGVLYEGRMFSRWL